MASQVESRGDCNYLFVSPTVHESVPPFSLAPVLAETQVTLSRERETLRAREQETQGLRREVEALRQETQRTQEETVRLQERLLAIENSVAWRVLNAYRKFRRYFGFGKNSAP